MNQLQLNKIAMHFIENQSAEVAAKLRSVLHIDARKRSEQIAGPALHYVHNIALFDCLIMVNTFFMIENKSQEALHEYIEYAETLRPKFIDLMESLKDFRPTTQIPNEDGE
jgi:hypothetical protein